ncbi:MAG: hypothetical protein HYY25_04910 [Candidatus Wallbacteria bacterium]|nr:hypothetical protein [Candidatus Wallbacteria bacterium]MBI4869502.1 hypothetical protein [Candidatus Wallbacteria bacterium]
MMRFQPPRAPRQFRNLNATQLFCPTCQRSMPVREKLALYLPTGALYHYVCAQCDSVLGKKEDAAPRVG